MTNLSKSNLSKTILGLYNDLIVLVDIKEKCIEKVYDGADLLEENITYEYFSVLFANIFNVNQESKEKIYKFFDNLNPSDEPFTINARYKDNNNETIRVDCRGYMYEDDKLMIAFSHPQTISSDEYDSLTKIYSYTGIVPKFQSAIESQRPFALMLLDLDEFSTFNESYGHMFGDIVLVEAAASLKKFVRSNGFVSRVSGDKFMILYYIEDNYDYVHNVCTLIRRAISDLQNHNIKQESIKATMGCTTYPKDGDSFDVLYKKAQMALDRGKRKGRDCFIIYDVNKCGSLDNYKIHKIDEEESSSNGISSHFNIIAGVFEILNRSGNKIKNIEDSLSLIGNYFLLDRVTMISFNPDDHTLARSYSWHNPRVKIKEVKPKKDQMIKWDKAFDKTGMIKIFQVESNKDLEIYPVLHENGTTSLLAFSLKNAERNMGTITFDMCGTNKFWNPTDVASLMLVSKIFTIFLNKEYENILHIRALSYDRLTKVYNYSKWRDSVYEYVSTSHNPQEYSLIYFNFEGFMHLNDLLGTAICDQALITVANGLRYLAKDEIFCRVSDDKYLVFLPTYDQNHIRKFIEQLECYLVDNYPYGKRFKIISGVYIHTDYSDNLTTAIDKANLARKQPRITEEGICFFTPELYENQVKKLKLERHMFEAKEDNEFLLYLQPKVNTVTGKVVGAEALTRWNFMHNKILTPNLFIPLFEQNGFINELDLIVFENVCRFQRDILDCGLTPVTISLNVSRYQTNFDEYIDKINIIREKYDISPNLIEIEITEGMYIDNIELISSMMKKLHKFGYSISMDDFGAGYSNLSSLASLDFDTIKLDRNFCSNKEGEKEKIILSFIMKLAEKLNVDVLCEGVETKELIDFLQSIGCNIVQGFYYDRPLPSEEFKNKYLVS